ncbi:DUF5686 and carboxypeptidase regulatory-like domain-containing protein [Marinoscillum furvescens]|uniref:Carboxypeptidase-like protein n=1 Tax=Marinoscillum furvescens DSM 4134 TaxID=1122208 RepID=A0A3D9KVQ5_MARFU|nr:DUF5686 and carboxypeptidase regulatory-like domain-containing protein [Marinoscillum furvescens]RED91737.1 carboxypeptidase-like protein [Marinoscillum furvescens DSM 4134]
MPCKSLLIYIGILLVCLSAKSQATVTGIITDSTGVPLPFATVYEQGTTNGTTSNANGIYTLNLSPGEHIIVAQYTGYQKKSTAVNVDTSSSDIKLDFRLLPETLVLQEVVISGDKKNLAKQIIRKAIKKRKYYANEVAAYTTEVYIKGLQRLDKRPKNLLGMTITIDTGIVYLSESISRIKYLHPDKINEKMISSKVSGNNNAFSYNQASEMLINLYDNSFYIEGLSERPFISPLANNAFLYYNYEFAGSIIEEDLYINKIKISPKRKTDPAFSGYIYIVDNSWRLHSVDVNLTRANGIEYLNSLNFNQVFAPVGHDIWMPISQRFTFEFDAFGFEGSGHFTAIYRNYDIVPNYYQPRKRKDETATKPKKKAPASPPPAQQQKNEAEALTEKDFSNAVLTVEEGANERDSMYWAAVRPIPLTPLEVKDYQLKDSLREIKSTKAYKDSVDQTRNQFKFGNLFFSGYTHYNSYERRYLTLPTLLEGLQYNSVEGLVMNLEFGFQKRNEHHTNYRITPAVRYGFANKKVQARIEGFKLLNPKKRSFILGGIGRYTYQLNNDNPIPNETNTFFSILRGKNYAKYYQKSFAKAGYQTELINGMLITAAAGYEQRTPMTNHASYNLANRDFTPNTPTNAEIGNTAFDTHEALLASLRLELSFAQQYIDRPDRKIILKSPYPKLHLYFKKGFPLLGSDVNYNLLKAGSTYEFRIGSMGTSEISTWAGAFVGTKTMSFVDFEHFNGNRIYLSKLGGQNLFQLLDYYTYSTQDRFLEAHYEHHFNEFIFNKIPLIKRLNLQAVASANYLTTPTAGQYMELGFGIEHIFKFFRVDFFTSMQDGAHQRNGIRVGAGF